jgi:hypothetical protein
MYFYFDVQLNKKNFFFLQERICFISWHSGKPESESYKSGEGW